MSLPSGNRILVDDGTGVTVSVRKSRKIARTFDQFFNNSMKKTLIRGLDKERETKERMHTTRPPRLEGKSKNAMMNPVKKKKSGTGHADRQV